jgi:hypothetical protein
MTVIRMTSEGHVYDIDFTRFTLGEAMALQKATGLEVDGLGTLITEEKNLEAMGAAMWLIRLRQIAAEKQCTIRHAATLEPHELFVDQLDLISLTAEELKDPKDPAPATRTTRTPRTTSSKPRTPGKRSASSRSAASRST